MRCLVVGSGLMAQGLARQYHIHCPKYCDHFLAVARTSSSAIEVGGEGSGREVIYRGVPIVDLETALQRADIVILAIPPHAYKPFVLKYHDRLSNCIMVDICNSPNKGENLAGLVRTLRNEENRRSSMATLQTMTSLSQTEHSVASSVASTDDNVSVDQGNEYLLSRERGMEGGIKITDSSDDSASTSPSVEKSAKFMRWVKAFNDCGAIDLLSRGEMTKNQFTTCMCGNNQEAVLHVKRFLEEAMGFNVITVHERYVDKLQSHQRSIGQRWTDATVIMLLSFFLAYAYVVVYFMTMHNVSWDQLPLYVTNKAIAWTALTGFALAQTPGVIAKMLSTWHKTIRNARNYRVPRLLVRLLLVRKHVGLLALFFLGMHGIMGTLIFSDVYSSRSFKSNGMLHARASWSMLFGIIGFMIYMVVAISSLPDVGRIMTSAQFRAVFGIVVWFGMLSGLVHVVVLGVVEWMEPEKWPGGMPPISIMSSAFPAVVLLLKFVQEVFCRVAQRSFTLGHSRRKM